MKIQCLGAAQGVTGSCYYIQTEDHQFLIDCGSFQGDFDVNKKNDTPFDFDPSELDFILLTHGHIDHSGRLPKLMQGQYHKPVYMTRGTASLTTILLKDSAKIHEYDNETENEKRKKAGLDEVEPYYTTDDVINLLPYFYPVPYDSFVSPYPNIRFKFISAGHLLGSAHIYLEIDDKSFLFSGDIGSTHNPLLIAPKPAPSADYIFMESTYGDRLHDDMTHAYEDLRDDILKATRKKGTVIIPAFSVGRTQEIIYALNQLKPDPEFSKINIYVDSPMAIEATKVFNTDLEGMKPEVISAIENKHHPFDMKQLTFVSDASTSYKLNFNKEPKVLISASGMCDAGRILHHLKMYLDKESTHIFFVGYQSEESLGRKIQKKDPEIQILKETVLNNSQVKTFHGFSGHADQQELLDWLSNIKAPKKIFLIHGESNSIEILSNKIQSIYHYDTYAPKLYEILEF